MVKHDTTDEWLEADFQRLGRTDVTYSYAPSDVVSMKLNAGRRNTDKAALEQGESDAHQ